MSAMGQVETHVGDLSRELGVTRQIAFIDMSGLMGSCVGTAKTCLTEFPAPLLPKCSCSISSAAVLKLIAETCSHYVILAGRVCSK